MNAPSGPRVKRDFLRRLKEARIGDTTAQYEVALMYANGAGVTKNLNQALFWTHAAAEKGNLSAQYLLARSYQQGLGTDRDPITAMSWYQKAAEKGHEKANFKLASIFSKPQDEIAFLYAMHAAKAGLAQAQLAVGVRLSSGLGVAQNIDDALNWYRVAADHGLAEAQVALGKAFEFGAGVEIDLVEACRWYRKAAMQGMPAAQLALECLDVAVGRSRKSKKPPIRSGSRERRVADSRWIAFAAKGGIDDFYHLGIMFESGIGVEKSLKQARLWYLKAAESGHRDAMVPLARLLVESTPAQAVHWYQKAAELGHSEAQYALGRAYLGGVGVVKDMPLALSWLAQSARTGNASSTYELYQLVQSSLHELNGAWLLSAAHAGVAQAQYEMGNRSSKGDSHPIDSHQACQWYRLSAEQGHAHGQCALALCYSAGLGVPQDAAKALYWFEQAAAGGDAQAQWNLGQLYAVGIPGVPQDAKQAILLCKRAATAGFVPAQATLGTLFARAKKHTRAVEWWSKAANQGDQEAQYNLANAYRHGLGVEKDLAKAFEWVMASATGGLAAAQASAGLAYATGEGAVQDPLESAKWFVLAARRGDAGAMANQQRAKRILSPAQWAEVERRAGQWAPTRPK